MTEETIINLTLVTKESKTCLLAFVFGRTYLAIISNW